MDTDPPEEQKIEMPIKRGARGQTTQLDKQYMKDIMEMARRDSLQIARPIDNDQCLKQYNLDL